MSHDRARRQVASDEGVPVERVRILTVQARQAGPTAKYIIDGEPGVRYRLLDDGAQEVPTGP